MSAFIFRALLFFIVYWIGYAIGTSRERNKHNESISKTNMNDIDNYIQHAVSTHLSKLGEFVDSEGLTDDDSKKMSDFHEFVKDLEKYTELMKIVGHQENNHSDKEG